MVPFHLRNQQPFNKFREILDSSHCHGPETLIRELPSLWALLSPFVAPPGLGGDFDKPESVCCLFRKDITIKRNCLNKVIADHLVTNDSDSLLQETDTAWKKPSTDFSDGSQFPDLYSLWILTEFTPHREYQATYFLFCLPNLKYKLWKDKGHFIYEF